MISIVIPTLNEADHIGKVLEHLLANSSAKNISEIIIVDGGSLDNTIHVLCCLFISLQASLGGFLEGHT